MAFLIGRVVKSLLAGGKVVAPAVARATLLTKLAPLLQGGRLALVEAPELHQLAIKSGKAVHILTQPRFMYQVEFAGAKTKWIVQIEEEASSLAVNISKAPFTTVKGLETTVIQDTQLFSTLERAFQSVGTTVHQVERTMGV